MLCGVSTRIKSLLRSREVMNSLTDAILTNSTTGERSTFWPVRSSLMSRCVFS